MLEKPVNEQAQKLSVITSTGSKSFRSHSEPKYKKQMNPNNGGESTPYSISQSPPLPDSSSDRNATKHSDQQTTSDLLVYEG